jgi:hypothetical protein
MIFYNGYVLLEDINNTENFVNLNNEIDDYFNDLIRNLMNFEDKDIVVVRVVFNFDISEENKEIIKNIFFDKFNPYDYEINISVEEKELVINVSICN